MTTATPPNVDHPTQCQPSHPMSFDNDDNDVMVVATTLTMHAHNHRPPTQHACTTAMMMTMMVAEADGGNGRDPPLYLVP